jgi:peptide deformylase
MAILKIAQMGEPVLRRRALDVPVEAIAKREIQSLIDDMIETMRDADGAGLAAPQVYQSLRISVIEVRDNPRYPAFAPIPLTVLVNPVLTVRSTMNGNVPAADDSIALYEGCLSVPGIRGRVVRPRAVEVRAFDRNSSPLSFVWEGVPAAVVQHETDHLNATLFVDRADPQTLCFLREYERHVPLGERMVDGAMRERS